MLMPVRRSGASGAVAGGADEFHFDAVSNRLERHSVNNARRVGIGIEAATMSSDFDSAIPRFESWRPSHYFHSAMSAFPLSPPFRSH